MSAALRFLDGGGEMAEVIRQRDWSDSPLGPPSGWPAALKMAVGTCLSSRFPMVVWWGPELLMFYNDAWRPILGEAKHRTGFGRPGAYSWPETWPIVGAQFEQALRGAASWSVDQLLAADRRGFLEECYFTYSHSPLRDASGDIVGVLTAVAETTSSVLGERRQRVLRRLSQAAFAAFGEQAAVSQAAASMLDILGLDNPDVAFALLYLEDREGEALHLRASAGLAARAPPFEARLPLNGEDAFGAIAACRTARPVEMAADPSLGKLPGGVWPEACKTILTLPIVTEDGNRPGGSLVCGLSPRLALDEAYRDFLQAAASHVAAMVDGLRARRQEHRRAEATTRLNRFERQAIATRTPEALLDLLLDEMIALHEADFGNVQLYDKQDRRFKIAVQRGFGPEFLSHFASVAADDGSACAQALVSGASVMIEDVETDAEYAPHRAIASRTGYRAVLSVPLRDSDTAEPVGMVSAYFRGPNRIRPSMITFTELHARAAADILIRRLAEQRLVESEAELQAANQDLERRVGERTRELTRANRELLLQIEQRARAEEALGQMQRLEAVGQLTAGIAHDFNNLLMVVLGNAEFLAGRLTDPDALRRLEMVRASAERGATLTAQLLAFSRQQQLSPRPTDVNATVRSMRELLTSTLRGTIRLRTSLARKPWPALADPGQVELVILNLCINARDAMPEGGELAIETRNVTAKRGSRKPGAPEPGDYVAICVRDTGVGMSAQVLARAFEPFFTTKPVGQGSGLGLAQVYGFAAQSGGGVTLESREGKGTAVRVFLPKAEARAERALPAKPEIAPDAGGRTVLLVDDDGAVRSTQAEALADLGYAVVQAASGPAALDILALRSDVDAMVVDFGMPDMNGAEFARQALARRPGTPLLFVTGFADRSALAAVPEASILRKPFRRADLAAKLAQAISAR